jgi:hAT family C-terminal dimerisation region
MLMDFDVRWNSAYRMLERALFLRKAISAWTSDDPDMDELHLSNAEWDQCSTLLKILLPFKQESTRIQRTKMHTIDLVFWTYQRLFDNLDTVVTELTGSRRRKTSRGTDAWKQQLLTAITEMTIHLRKYYAEAVQGIYYMAVLLDPFTKTTLFESESWKGDGKDYVKEYVDKTRDFYIQHYETLELAVPVSTINIPTKRKRIDDDDADDDDYRRKLINNVDSRIQNEFDRYLASPRAIDNGRILPILEWWKKNEHEFPHLAHMFRDIYSVPASSAGVEREFSKGGRVAIPERARLNPTTITETMMYKSYLVRCGDTAMDEGIDSDLDDEDEHNLVAKHARVAMRNWSLERDS